VNSLEYSCKAICKSKKEIVHERLLRATVLAASELAARKQAEIDRANAFTRSAEDESFYNCTELSVSPVEPSPIGQRVAIITREPYEEQP
jgi:hypothetical protein